MTTPTKPNAGALRAARVLEGMSDAAHKGQRPQLIADEIAEVIDQESGLAELLKCCELMLPYFDGSRGATDENVSRIVAIIEKVAGRSIEATKHLNAAIAKASNPNAETVRSYPLGRWTEKGTV